MIEDVVKTKKAPNLETRTYRWRVTYDVGVVRKPPAPPQPVKEFIVYALTETMARAKLVANGYPDTCVITEIGRVFTDGTTEYEAGEGKLVVDDPYGKPPDQAVKK